MRKYPKYMDNMHLVVNAISGDISIASIKMENGRGISDKQKDVSKEFFDCLMLKADKLPLGEFAFREAIGKDERIFYMFAKAPVAHTLPEILRAMATQIEASTGAELKGAQCVGESRE